MTHEQIPPPPRIKAWPWNGKRISGQWHVAGLGETTDYVRGDLFAAQAAELATLRAERDAAVEQCAVACDKIAGNTADFSRDHRRAAGQCAAMIRALKGGA